MGKKSRMMMVEKGDGKEFLHQFDFSNVSPDPHIIPKQTITELDTPEEGVGVGQYTVDLDLWPNLHIYKSGGGLGFQRHSGDDDWDKLRVGTQALTLQAGMVILARIKFTLGGYGNIGISSEKNVSIYTSTKRNVLFGASNYTPFFRYQTSATTYVDLFTSGDPNHPIDSTDVLNYAVEYLDNTGTLVNLYFKCKDFTSTGGNDYSDWVQIASNITAFVDATPLYATSNLPNNRTMEVYDYSEIIGFADGELPADPTILDNYLQT